MRCSRCGNDAPKEEYVCSFCGARLKIEAIEKIKIFRRQEEKWLKPDKPIKRIWNIIKNPSRAFWDISHMGDSTGPFLVVLFNALTLGLWVWAIYIHISFADTLLAFAYGFGVFITYFLWGLVYYLLIFFLFNILFSLGANFSSNLNNIIQMRYKSAEEKSNQTEKNVQAMMDKLESKKPGKQKILLYAYSPFIITNLISTLILLIGTPSGDITTVISQTFSGSLFIIIDVLNIITLIGWIPITVTIALRDLANSSTGKLLIGSIIIGIITSYMLFFLRHWNLGLIQSMG